MQVIFGGNGPVGTELARQLVAAGTPPREIRAVCRSGRAAVPAGVEVRATDVSTRAGAQRAAAGARVVYCCIGVDYTRFAQLWPPLVDALLWAAQSVRARVVFADNLYAYGPQAAPLREDMPLTGYGRKPRLRAMLQRHLLDAHQAGRCPVALVKASDFYGPGVTRSHLGDRVFPAAMAGRAAQVIGDPGARHTYTYVPDFARALRLVAAADDAFGAAWHVPNAPACPIADVVQLVYQLAGKPYRLQALPLWLVRLLGHFDPLLRELSEMDFQWDRAYLVDHGKFATRFGERFTPLKDGLKATLEWYVQRALSG
jgi:nucleoside-diphosphate-sugar epimerase